MATCVSWTPTLDKAETNSPQFVRALLALRCANLPRLSSSAILTGHYGGAAVLLRASFESLVYLYLFHDDANEIGLWLRTELHPGLDPMDRDRQRREHLNRAKDSLARRALGERRERELMRLLWHKTSRHIHSSVVVLAQTFGLDFKDLLPDGFWVALEGAGDDWGLALDLVSLRSADGKAWAKAGHAGYPKQEVRLMLTGRYDDAEAGLLSDLAVFLGRRLADLAFDAFDAAGDLREESRRWRAEAGQGP